MVKRAGTRSELFNTQADIFAPPPTWLYVELSLTTEAAMQETSPAAVDDVQKLKMPIDIIQHILPHAHTATIPMDDEFVFLYSSGALNGREFALLLIQSRSMVVV